jgi:hypothetical protein
MLLDAYLLQDDLSKINIKPFFNIEQKALLLKTYKDVDFKEELSDEDLIDKCGYFGQFNREKQKLSHINEIELYKILASDTKLFA